LSIASQIASTWLECKVVVQESRMQDSGRIFAPAPPKTRDASAGSVARMGFVCRIFGRILGESGAISAAIPANSCRRIPGCMRLIEHVKQLNP
jgi:hypothetical protein